LQGGVRGVHRKDGYFCFPDSFSMSCRYSASGKSLTGTFEGIIARILQHEIDHLNGLLFVDRRPFKLLPEAEYLQLMEKESGKQK
jgi:hypothetical protein